MIFKEATAYQLSNFKLSHSELNAKLSQFCFTPAHETSISAHGFISPIAERPDDLVVQVQHVLGFTYRTDKKSVPKAKVTALTEKRISAMEEKGTVVTKQLASDIESSAEKDLLRMELPKTKLINGFIDKTNNWIYFNSKSFSVCEEVLSAIRKAIGSFSVLPGMTELPPSKLLCLSLCDDKHHLATGVEINTYGKIKAVGDKASHKITFEGIGIGTHELEVLADTNITQADLRFWESDDIDESNCWGFTITTQNGHQPFSLSKLHYSPKNDMDHSPFVNKNDIDYLADLLISASLLHEINQRLGDSFGGFVDFEKEKT